MEGPDLLNSFPDSQILRTFVGFFLCPSRSEDDWLTSGLPLRVSCLLVYGSVNYLNFVEVHW